jgi:hypothetical protein
MSQIKKRPSQTVSFNNEAMPAAVSSGSLIQGERKPSLKRTASSHKPASLPDEIWMHTDALLRRLRLLDCYEEPLDLQKAFQEVQIVGEFITSRLFDLGWS